MLVMVIGWPLGSVAEITDVITVGSYEVVSACCDWLADDVGRLEKLVEVCVEVWVDVCGNQGAKKRRGSARMISAYSGVVGPNARDGEERWICVPAETPWAPSLEVRRLLPRRHGMLDRSIFVSEIRQIATGFGTGSRGGVWLPKHFGDVTWVDVTHKPAVKIGRPTTTGTDRGEAGRGGMTENREAFARTGASDDDEGAASDDDDVFENDELTEDVSCCCDEEEVLLLVALTLEWGKRAC